MNQVQQTYKIKASITAVWDALTNPKTIAAWGAGPNVKMSPLEGFEFSLWDGDIYGTNTQVNAPILLVQDWYGGDWSSPSQVRFELSSEDEYTIVNLTHNSLPEDEVSNFDEGWKDYYLGAIKTYLEQN